MRRISFFIVLVLTASLNFSCANLKSSLSKSDSSDSKDYSSKPTYSSSSKDSVTVVKTSTSYNTGREGERNLNSGDLRSDRKEYGTPVTDRKFTENPVGRTGGDFNQNLVIQYSEMDKLADRVLYELEINEKQKEGLLDRFKSASSNDRENISQELNKLDVNQLTLYKAYVRVYKDGKTNWPAVRKSVEDTLLSLRGIGNK